MQPSSTLASIGNNHHKQQTNTIERTGSRFDERQGKQKKKENNCIYQISSEFCFQIRFLEESKKNIDLTKDSSYDMKGSRRSMFNYGATVQTDRRIHLQEVPISKERRIGKWCSMSSKLLC